MFVRMLSRPIGGLSMVFSFTFICMFACYVTPVGAMSMALSHVYVYIIHYILADLFGM